MEALQTALVLLDTHGAALATGLGTTLASLVAGLGVATCVFVLLPEDFLERPERARSGSDRPEWVRVALKIGKNVVGVAIIGAGAALALPGVPGPGVLTMVMGVMLVDIPGKRRLVRRALRTLRVLGPVNRLRRRLGRPPLRLGVLHDQTA